MTALRDSSETTRFILPACLDWQCGTQKSLFEASGLHSSRFLAGLMKPLAESEDSV
jgi:hypothetical protein